MILYDRRGRAARLARRAGPAAAAPAGRPRARGARRRGTAARVTRAQERFAEGVARRRRARARRRAADAARPPQAMAAQAEARTGTSELDVSPANREIGDEAVWSLSTAKPGNGVEQIRAAPGGKRRAPRDFDASAFARYCGRSSSFHRDIDERKRLVQQ